MQELWEELEKLKKCKWIDLTHLLNDQSPYWSGIPEGSVELGKTVYDWGQELECTIQTFKFPGQFGTHIDFPGHFDKNGNLSDKFEIKELVFPLCIIDVSEKVKENVNYELRMSDIEEFENQYGKIPSGSFVALRTDWSKRWPDMDQLSNYDKDGNENFPGWTLETLKFLYEERHISGNGHETLDTDASAVAAREGDLVCERYVLSRGCIQVEALDHLEQLPPVGAIIFITFPNIESACGLPARVFAITK